MENLTLDTLLGHAQAQLKRWQRTHNDIQDYQVAYTRKGIRFHDIFDYQAYMTLKKFETQIKNSNTDWLTELFSQNKCIYQIRRNTPVLEAIRNISFIYTPVGKSLHAYLYNELAKMRHVHFIKNPQPFKSSIKANVSTSGIEGPTKKDVEEKFETLSITSGVQVKDILVWLPSVTAPTYSIVFLNEALQKKLKWPLKIGYVQINPHHVDFRQFHFELLYDSKNSAPLLTFRSFNLNHDMGLSRIVEPVNKLEDIFMPEIKKVFKLKDSGRDIALATERGQVDNHKEKYSLLHSGGMLIEAASWNNYELLNNGEGNAATWISSSSAHVMQSLETQKNYAVREGDSKLYVVNALEQTATPESTLGAGVTQIKETLILAVASACLEPQVLNL